MKMEDDQKQVKSGSNVNLVDFQKRLNANLEEASKADDLSSLIGFTSAGKNWLMELGDLREIAGVPTYEQTQRVALAKQWVLGLANFKGYIYTLVDFQVFLGQGLTALGMNARSLLLHPRFPVQSALIVGDVSGLVARSELTPIQGWKASQPWVKEGFKSASGETWELIDTAMFAESREILNIEM